MSSIDQVSEERASVRSDLSAIFVSLELSLTTWLVTSLSPGSWEKSPSTRCVAAMSRAFLRGFPNCRQSARRGQGGRTV